MNLTERTLGTKEKVGNRRNNEETTPGDPYWYIVGSEFFNTTNADSSLSLEILEQLQS